MGSLSPSKLGTCVTSNSKRVVVVQGGSKTTIFVSPPTPSLPLPFFLVSAMAFHWYLYFPPEQGEVFPASKQSHRHWIQLRKVGCTPTPSPAIGLIYSHDLKRCFDTPPLQLCSTLKAFCACVWSFVLPAVCVGVRQRPGAYLGYSAPVMFWSSQSPQTASVLGAWPQRLRISTWEWIITEDALGTGWAGSLPGSSYSRRLREVGNIIWDEGQLRLLDLETAFK